MEKILAKSTSFVDNYGRTRIFNGVNICDKTHYTIYSDGYSPLDELTAKKLSQLGFNVIRLGITWASIQPEINVYNDKIINKIIEVMDICRKYNIYVYIDMHQDLYSDFGNHENWGDGAPKWATLSDGLKRGKFRFVWAEGYFWNKAVHKAFDNFWCNKPVNGIGLTDRFAMCWQYIASKVKDHPALLGYDVLNEPFPGKAGGDVFKRIVAGGAKTVLFTNQIDKGKAINSLITKKGTPLDVITGNVMNNVIKSSSPIIKNFDENSYSPFLNKVAKSIRKETDNGIIFIENCYYSNLGIPCYTKPIEINDNRESLQCFSPHGYDLMVDTPLYKYANNDRIDKIFEQHRLTQKRLNVPVLVGEWGGEADGIDWLNHISHILDIFDKNQWSNTYWAFNHLKFEQPIMNILSRPYPQAVTGEIDYYKYNRNSRTFELSFFQSNEYTVPTTIYLPCRPLKITTNGRYEIKQLSDNGQCLLNVHCNVGKNKISVIL